MALFHFGVDVFAVIIVIIINMDFIVSGKTPANPSELLLDPRFKLLLDWVPKYYDIVIVDTPPVLVVTDAGIVSEDCGTTLLIAVEKPGSNSYSYGYYNCSYGSDKA